MVHDAIAYAPYELRFFNQAYTAYEFIVKALDVLIILKVKNSLLYVTIPPEY
jgi:hypothetical protein